MLTFTNIFKQVCAFDFHLKNSLLVIVEGERNVRLLNAIDYHEIESFKLNFDCTEVSISLCGNFIGLLSKWGY